MPMIWFVNIVNKPSYSVIGKLQAPSHPLMNELLSHLTSLLTIPAISADNG